MWRRILLVALLLLAALCAAGPALAQSAGRVVMAGQETVTRTGAQPQILLSAAATDGSGWKLQATLTGRDAGRPRRSGGFTQSNDTPLRGQFTLSHAGISPVTGDAAGNITQDGSGRLKLLGGDGETDLDAAFTQDPAGGLTLNLSGRLPALPASAEAAAGPSVNHSFWYISRAAGLTAYLLLALSVCLGLLVRTRVLEWLAARWRWFDLHQFTALLALAFVGLHIFSLLGDHYIGFTLDELFIPFASPYRPIWIAAGIVALYLMLAVISSFYIRRVIGYRGWRTIHYLTFAVFLLALLHGLLSGTDTGQLWAVTLYWGSCMLLGGLVIWRFTSTGRTRHASAPALPESAAELHVRELEPTRY